MTMGRRGDENFIIYVFEGKIIEIKFGKPSIK